MKKISWATHKSLFGQIASSTCLVGASAGVIFGVSAATFKVQYMNLNSAEARLKAAQEHNYYNQNIISQWNMYQKGTEGEEGFVKGVAQPNDAKILDGWWDKVHPGTKPLYVKDKDINPAIMELEDQAGKEIPSGTPISDDAKAERKKYSALVIDGSTHTAMDRSFNQGLYNGLVNFNQNNKVDVKDDKDAQVFKPSQDSTQEFINIYRAVAAKTRVLSLAGFNHVTPLNALGKQTDEGLYEFTDPNIASTGMMLMDGDVTNNQNVASVLFRSDEPAFLTALATCMYFYNNLHLYHDHHQDISVATYGGTAIPTVIIYMGGFERGIEFFNRMILKNKLLNLGAKAYMKSQPSSVPEQYFANKLLPASKYKEDVEKIRAQAEGAEKETAIDEIINKLYDEYSIKMIKLGDFGTHFSGTFNSGDAIGISKQYLNRGASAILAVAGPQSLDTAQEIMNQNSKAIVIGVDSAMERSDYQKPFKTTAYEDKSVGLDGTKSTQANNIIKFSAVKDMTNVSDKMLRLAGRGLHWDVDTEAPWTSMSQLPEIDEDKVAKVSPVTEFESQWYAGCLKVNFDDANKTFDIVGFKENGVLTYAHILRIPLQLKKPGVADEYNLKSISGFDLSTGAKNLQYIDTLCFSGEHKEPITFGANGNSAFNYSGWSGDNIGIKYIDFRNLITSQINFDTGDNPVFKKMVGKEKGVYHAGIIKMNPATHENVKKNLYYKLFNVDDDRKGWPIVEPDPYRSICSFGFKTCGNIENGLISISWDGWPLLFEALNFLTFENDESFWDNWIALGKEYCTEKGIEGEFHELFKNPDITKFITYDTKSPLQENYAHVMAILGKVLKTKSMSFEKDMTILLDDEGKPYLPVNNTAMSILDWLKTNMYFTL